MSSEKGKTYKIRLSSKAAKYLSSLDKTKATRILNKLELLKAGPYHLPGAKPLTGQFAGLHRLRIGNCRATYMVNEGELIVIVLVIGPRGDIYK